MTTEALAVGPPPSSRPESAESARAVAIPPSRTTFSQVFEAVGREIDRGERLAQTASRGVGTGLDAAQLIALQSGIYRYTELVELSAKLVDRATNAAKTVLQSGT